MKSKRLILSLFFIIGSISLFTLFRGNNIFQRVEILFIFFIGLPFLFNKFFLKRNMDFFGFNIGDWKKGLFWSVCSLFFVGIIFFIIAKYFNFLDYYIIPKYISESFGKFIYYEFVIVLLIVFLYEFYFRGFVMSIFKEEFKYWSILIQFLIFLLLCSVLGGWFGIFLFLPYLLFAPFAGFIVYESKSILYSGMAQFLIIFFLDLIVIKILK